ncbi:hypothetical protein PRO82_000036 [Candidatus Protochlamydia amoebophila]|nr:hypothetical protein [Candidatus Protochlamydia amoebophila]
MLKGFVNPQLNVRNLQKYSRSLAALISVFEKNSQGLDEFK